MHYDIFGDDNTAEHDFAGASDWFYLILRNFRRKDAP